MKNVNPKPPGRPKDVWRQQVVVSQEGVPAGYRRLASGKIIKYVRRNEREKLK